MKPFRFNWKFFVDADVAVKGGGYNFTRQVQLSQWIKV